MLLHFYLKCFNISYDQMWFLTLNTMSKGFCLRNNPVWTTYICVNKIRGSVCCVICLTAKRSSQCTVMAISRITSTSSRSNGTSIPVHTTIHVPTAMQLQKINQINITSKPGVTLTESDNPQGSYKRFSSLLWIFHYMTLNRQTVLTHIVSSYPSCCYIPLDSMWLWILSTYIP